MFYPILNLPKNYLMILLQTKFIKIILDVCFGFTIVKTKTNKRQSSLTSSKQYDQYAK